MVQCDIQAEKVVLVDLLDCSIVIFQETSVSGASGKLNLSESPSMNLFSAFQPTKLGTLLADAPTSIYPKSCL